MPLKTANCVLPTSPTQKASCVSSSIPSPKAEPFKRWLAEVGEERLEEIEDPELAISRALYTYRRKGYSESWINQRLKTIEVRKERTDEWDRSGVHSGFEYASLTDIISKAWSGMTTREYKKLKGLRKENLRDNMSNLELILNMLAEASATELSKQKNPRGFEEAHGSRNAAVTSPEKPGNSSKPRPESPSAPRTAAA